MTTQALKKVLRDTYRVVEQDDDMVYLSNGFAMWIVSAGHNILSDSNLFPRLPVPGTCIRYGFDGSATEYKAVCAPLWNGKHTFEPATVSSLLVEHGGDRYRPVLLHDDTVTWINDAYLAPLDYGDASLLVATCKGLGCPVYISVLKPHQSKTNNRIYHAVIMPMTASFLLDRLTTLCEMRRIVDATVCLLQKVKAEAAD